MQNLFSMQCIEGKRYYTVKYFYFNSFTVLNTLESRLPINIEHLTQQL